MLSTDDRSRSSSSKTGRPGARGGSRNVKGAGGGGVGACSMGGVGNRTPCARTASSCSARSRFSASSGSPVAVGSSMKSGRPRGLRGGGGTSPNPFSIRLDLGEVAVWLITASWRGEASLGVSALGVGVGGLGEPPRGVPCCGVPRRCSDKPSSAPLLWGSGVVESGRLGGSASVEPRSDWASGSPNGSSGSA